MQNRVLKTLEYDKIIDMLRERCSCFLGRELAQELSPAYGFSEAEKSLALTSEAEALLFQSGASPVDDFPDVRECLKRMRAALYLSGGELLSVARVLRASRTCKEAILSGTESGFLRNMASSLITHQSVEGEIARCIIGEDEIADGASSDLSRIRRAMRVANDRVREKLNAMIRSSTYQKYLQEALITIRNGRFVLPVKQEYRQHVPGLVHDQSASGATLFIEPASVVELGNAYKKLLLEEAEEIERILTALTALVSPHADDILQNILLLGDMDIAFAKARLSREMGAVRPKLNENARIRIVRGRHPLIARDVVVPIDIWLGEDFKTLIITGPNTGGKTVTLKTVGLFTLMAQSGMFVPAAEGTELAVFKQVFADIGDEQSIEQSLSTFSSHMTNIVRILNTAGLNSLVLLDELGAGTDPVEGAALAMSILQELHARSCITVATTHYSEIKAFALTREGMENASMEFDVDKLCPTYRLFIGIPGRSNAFEISRRLGLGEGVIEDAKRFLKGEDVKFEDIISSAESQRRVAEQERRLAEEARGELERLRKEAEKERAKLDGERSRLRAGAREEAKRIVEGAKREMEKLIGEIRSIKEIDQRAADRVIQGARDAMRAEEGKLIQEPGEPKRDGGKPPKTVKAGETVRIASLDAIATVLSPPDGKGEVMVQAGIVKLSVKLSDLRTVEAGRENPAQAASAHVVKAGTVGLELDIRGMLVEDAKPIVDRYLDDALMQGLSEVNIIHGKGTGALRAGIQGHLKGHARVKSFRIGNYGEGDAGVTVVAIRK